MRPASFFLALMALYACETSSPKVNHETLKKDIVAIEAEFARFLKDSGVASAFYKFAAPDAVIKRGEDSLIKGKESIRNYYSGAAYKNAVAEWAPDFVDLSEDGTMAYTFGRYNWTFRDSAGKETNYKGVFHTVWKKMNDGTWKYVWD